MGEPRGPRRPARLLSALVTSAALAVLAACSDGADPPVVADPAPTTSPAATSPSPTSNGKKAAVEAAVRAYYEAMERAVATGETKQLESLSTVTCNCRRLVASIDRLYSDGMAEGVDVHDVRTHVRNVRGRTATASVTFVSEPYTIIRGDRRTSVPRREANELVDLVAQDGRWLVSNVLDLDR